MVEAPQQDLAEVNFPMATIGRHEADALMGESTADEDAAPVPDEGAVSFQDDVVTEWRRFGAIETAWILPRGTMVDGRWRLLPERLVRSLLVVLHSVKVECTLL